MTQTKLIIEQFNVVARTEYNRVYKEFEPKFKDMLFSYESGLVESTSFPFFLFLQQMEEFKGSRKHQTFPEGFTFLVQNKEFDMAVDIPLKDIERASNQKNNALAGLNIYKLRISEIPKMIKDHPIELAFQMLEAGSGTTLGTCFDQQALFSATHSYDIKAGSQSNIITGTGITETKIRDDIIALVSRLDGFYIEQSQNTAKRKLNKQVNKLFIVCSTELSGIFWNLKNPSSNSVNNNVSQLFDYVSIPMADPNDWYGMLNDELIFRPFLHQIEKKAILDLPSPSNESMREKKLATYGAYGRYNVAYGAWWKICKITNT